MLEEDLGSRRCGHNHDFWWEESGEVYPTCPEVVEFYERYAPPVLPNVRHCVINRIAQGELRARKGVEARVVPNVFDFNQPLWSVDDYNRRLSRVHRAPAKRHLFPASDARPRPEGYRVGHRRDCGAAKAR